MTENQTFSLDRMMRLTAKNLREEWRSLTLMSCSLLGILFLIGFLTTISLTLSTELPEDFERTVLMIEIGWYTPLFAIAGLLMASTSFKQLSTPAGALGMLTTPASQLEKFLYRWIIAVPVCLAAFFIFFGITELLRALYTYIIYGIRIDPFLFWDYIGNDLSWRGFSLMILGYLFLQSFYLLGSLLWTRWVFLKTFLALFAIQTVYSWVAIGIVHAFDLENKHYTGPRFEWLTDNDGSHAFIVGCLLFGLLTLFNYWLSYRRYREAEIINRW
ncbi:MAG: hypothetical protein NC212_05520 [Staphylococcus sp.]|nr:hypothetical protein [Staphylococcus sp.]